MTRRKRRNNRKKSAGFIIPKPLLSVLALATLLSLSYLWMMGRCEAAGQRIKTLEQRRTDLHSRVLNEEYKWANMRSPRNMEAALRRHNLVMTWPSENRVVRRAAPEWPAGHEEFERIAYAQYGGTHMNDQ